MVRSIWLALYFLISFCALVALKASIALMPKQDALRPVAASTANIEQDLPLAKSDRLPIAATEQAPYRYFAGGAITALPPLTAAPDETASPAQASIPAASFAEAKASGAPAAKTTNTDATNNKPTNAKTATSHPWRNAYAEKRQRHSSASKRHSRQGNTGHRKPRKH
ncbi:hypothetical protein DB459_20125 [Bradyrhizobium sp. WD16]|nr:hypothetical protein DB459_20125 [Bradyrhizobium sp. WD16]